VPTPPILARRRDFAARATRPLPRGLDAAAKRDQDPSGGHRQPVAAVAYAFLAPVEWRYALTLMVASLVGGRTGALLARRVTGETLRLAIAVMASWSPQYGRPRLWLSAEATGFRVAFRVLRASEAHWRPSNQMRVQNNDLAKQLGALGAGREIVALAPARPPLSIVIASRKSSTSYWRETGESGFDD